MTEKTEITVLGSFLTVKPAQVSILGPALTFSKKTTQFDQRKKKRVMALVPTAVYKYDIEEDVLVVPSGLLDRVLFNLRKHKVEHTINRYKASEATPERNLVMANIDLSSLRPEQVNMLRAIVSNTHTTCKAATGAGKSFLISSLCKIYPNARIVVTTDSKDVISTLKSYLEDATGEPVGHLGGGKHSEERITVSTLQSLTKMHKKPHILIVDEVHVVGADSYAQACLETGSEAFKFVGLSATPDGRADNADMIIEGVCGPTRVESTYQDSVDSGSVSPIEVDVYTCREGPDFLKTSVMKTQADKDRAAIWANTARNKLIADVTKLEVAANPDDQVLIYCDITEHAIRLSKLLPGFTLVTGQLDGEREDDLGPALMEGVTICSPKQRELYKTQFENKELKYAICSRIWQKGVSFNSLKILVRADALPNDITNIQACGRLSRTEAEKSKGRVIDFDDVFNRSYQFRAKVRLGLYEGLKWKVDRKTL
jgi:superfamily II DNA or RNA helicase